MGRYFASIYSLFILAFELMPTRARQPHISPRKAPRQARSAFTVQTIVEAATRVLATESLKGFNTNRVAEVAGVSVGSLYQYFPSKDALMATLIAHEQSKLAQAVEACVDASAGRPLRNALESLAKIAIAHQWGNPVYAAALDHEEQRLPVSDTLQAIQLRVVNAVVRLLKTHLPTLPESTFLQLAKDCVVVAKALIEAEPINASKKNLQYRLVSLLMANMSTHTPPPSQRSKRGLPMSK
jgi:AcrR family transcriptional regulator